jgi:hypothetical protein
MSYELSAWLVQCNLRASARLRRDLLDRSANTAIAEFRAISIGDHGLSRLLAEKLSPRDLELLQQNRHITDNPAAPAFVRYWSNSRQWPALALNGSVANDP